MQALRHARECKPVRDAAYFAVCFLLRPDVQAFTDAKKCALTLQSFKCAAPYRDYVPAFVLPCLFVAFVALYVLRPFFHPELHIAFGHCGIGASVTVPEAAADIDDGTGLGDDNVWPSRKPLVAHPEPPSGGKDPLADKNLGFCVPAPYPAHYLASLLWRYPIHNCRRLYHKMVDAEMGVFDRAGR